MSAVPAQTATVARVASGANGCYDLLAGRTIGVGHVCFAVDETYNAGNVTGEASYTFTVPLGPMVDFDLENLDQYCPDGAAGTIYAMAHAAVQLVDGSGNVIQTETGWSNGEGIVEKGSWATRTEIKLEVTCEDTPPPPTLPGQETAVMFGSLGFNVLFDYTESNQGVSPDNVPDSRWGWQDGPLHVYSGVGSDDTYVNPIYAGAGQSNIAQGTYVGDVTVDMVSGIVAVATNLFTYNEGDAYVAENTYVYVGAEPACSANFGNA